MRSALAMRIARSTRCRICAGVDAHVDEFVRHVLEQRDEIHFLLVIAAERRARLLPDDRDDRLVIHLRVVKAVEQMNRARTARRQADADFAGELRVRASHERRHLLVPHLHVIRSVAGAIDRAHDAVDAIAGKTVNALEPHSVSRLIKKSLTSFDIISFSLLAAERRWL